MSTVEQFRHAMMQATAGTPYTVSPIDDGFILHLEIANAQWYGLFNRAGLKEEYTCRVTVDGEKYKLLQGRRSIDWVAGAPRTGGRIEWASGWVWQRSKKQVWAWDEQGRFGKVVDYTFDSGEGKQLVKAVAERLGLRAGMPGRVKGALIFAVIAGIGAIITVVVMGFFLLSGDYEQVCHQDGNTKTCTWEKKSP